MNEKRMREEAFSRILLRGAAMCALLICVLFLMVVVTGCGTKKNQTQEEQHPQTESIVKEEPVTEECGVGNLIEDQTFDVTLQPFGQVTFASYEPDTSENPLADATFCIEQDGKVLTRLPSVTEDNVNSEMFDAVEAVSFLDYNYDGYDDIILIISYYLGAGPQAATPHSTIRYYLGSGDGTFTYQEQMSLDATSALAEITIKTAKDFIGYKKVADETDYSGIYTDTQGTDDIYSELEVKKQSDGSYLFSMGLYRLTTIEGTAKQNGNILYFNGTDASGNPIEGYITITEEKAVATFTNSTWVYIKNGDVYEFPSGKIEKIALEPWQEAYIQYLQQDSDVAGQDGYTLINMSADEIPQLVEVGNCEASGCRIVHFADGKVHVTQLGRLNFTYIPNGNLLCNSDGNMDTYYDLVYSIIDGEMTLIAQGYYGAKDNSNLKFDSEGNPIYQYEWNGVEMSKEEYAKELNRIYDTTKAVGYAYDNLYSVEEVIEMVEEYQK